MFRTCIACLYWYYVITEEILTQKLMPRLIYCKAVSALRLPHMIEQRERKVCWFLRWRFAIFPLGSYRFSYSRGVCMEVELTLDCFCRYSSGQSPNSQKISLNVSICDRVFRLSVWLLDWQFQWPSKTFTFIRFVQQNVIFCLPPYQLRNGGRLLCWVSRR